MRKCHAKSLVDNLKHLKTEAEIFRPPPNFARAVAIPFIVRLVMVMMDAVNL